MEKQDLQVLRDKLRKLQHNQWDQMLKEGRKDEVLLALIQDTYRHCNEVDNMAIELIHQLISKFDELNPFFHHQVDGASPLGTQVEPPLML